MKAIEKKYIVPFALVSILFLLWGIANNMTDTLLSAFKRIMSMTDTQTSFIQMAFYGAYFCLALPAALYIRKHSYKSGVVLGLILYSTGAILFFPASRAASYAFYLVAIYIMAGGCSVLETAANPYIMSMGTPETATRRLNIAQSFNPLGSITGILLSQFFILSELSSASASERAAMAPEALEAMQQHELNAVTGTYATLGVALIVILIIMLSVKMPEGNDGASETRLKDTFTRLLSNRKYTFGVIAQFFYIGSQIGVWSFTIRLVMSELGVLEAEGASLYLISIIGFSAARFLFTWLMKWIRPSKLLAVAAVADIICSLLVIFGGGTGWMCVIALISISFFMSLMFPTIYGIALCDVGEDAKIGASGLIMAILGAAVFTPVQAKISDLFGINISYVVPLVCFVVVLAYALYIEKDALRRKIQ